MGHIQKQTRVKKKATLVFTIGLFIILYLGCNNISGCASHLPIFIGNVPTPSMFPTINQGDLIIVNTLVDFSYVTINDVVVFNTPIGMVVHRVIDVKEDALITKGDYNPKPDPPITEDMYIGSVIHMIEYGLYLQALAFGFVLGWISRWVVRYKRNHHLEKQNPRNKI